ncbi:caspase-1-like [Ornithodoros turicata]|uniref:caspase-1-like n=1 Tax=Ornithodoros turicata TaxID=34597 RepID=UPI0031389332
MTEAGTGCYTIPPECSQDELFYKTYHQAGGRRGTCFIINIKDVPGKERRWGTEQDFKKIQEVFGDVLRFDIHFRIDPKKTDLERALLQCSEAIGKDLSSDSFACFALSHGDDGFILCGDGQKFNTQDIFAYFTDEACPSLAGKPKFFFIQVSLWIIALTSTVRNLSNCTSDL